MENKNLLVAVLLSVFVLGLWQHFYAIPASRKIQKAQINTSDSYIGTKKDSDSGQSPSYIGNNVDFDEPLKETLDRDILLNESKANRIAIKTPKMEGSVNLTGARFDDLTLVDYKESKEKNAKEVSLFSPGGSKTVYFAEFGWLLDTRIHPYEGEHVIPDHSTLWQSDSQELWANKPVTLSWDNKKGLKFFIKISVDSDYMFTINQSVKNYGDKDFHFFPYGTINRVRDMSKKTFYISHEGAIGSFDGVLSEITYSKLKKKKKTSFKENKGWFGISDKYWFTAIIPYQEMVFDTGFTYYNYNSQDRFQADYRGPDIKVVPGALYSYKVNLFSGAKELNLLDKYNEDLQTSLLDRAVDFGWLYFITKPMFKFLTFLHKIVGNFGIAILVLTIFVKAVLFPLANKSYTSMHKIKILQPKINEIKERYKDDKVQLNTHLMSIYRDEKVNPLSGCLPMLIQVPIFFSLYKVLFVSIEMRQAEFFGWITDLSLPDPTSVFTLFGLIDINLPDFLHVGIFPILMSCSMVLQQKMSPPQNDPVQARIMSYIPYVFLFIFSSFPSGLVIYWTWNNLLSVLQQWLIIRKLKK